MKHICNACRRKYSALTMHRVSVQDGEHRIWTPARAAYFRSHRMKYPVLVWLCGKCYSRAQQVPAQEGCTGKPAHLRRRHAQDKRNTTARKGEVYL